MKCGCMMNFGTCKAVLKEIIYHEVVWDVGLTLCWVFCWKVYCQGEGHRVWILKNDSLSHIFWMMNLCTLDLFPPSIHFFLIDVAGGQVWNQHTQRGNKECDGSEADSEWERDQNPAAGDRNCEGEYCSVPAYHTHQSFCCLVDT